MVTALFTLQAASLKIFELCDWLGRNPSLGNPFVDAVRHEHVVALNYTAGYTDIMLAKVS